MPRERNGNEQENVFDILLEGDFSTKNLPKSDPIGVKVDTHDKIGARGGKFPVGFHAHVQDQADEDHPKHQQKTHPSR